MQTNFNVQGAVAETANNALQLDIIKSKTPEWLLTATTHTLTAMRETLREPLPWFEDANLHKSDIVQKLHQLQAKYRLNHQRLDTVLSQLPPPDVFAEPLLTSALKARFGVDVDVRKAYLFHARRFRSDQSFVGASKDPVVAFNTSLKAATQTLLSAALQNFEAWESEAGGMDKDDQFKAAIYDRYPINGITVSGNTLNIPAEQFAQTCRELDIGGKYQALMQTVLNPPSPSDEAPDAEAYKLRALFKRNEQGAFGLNVHLAYLKEDISRVMHDALVEVAKNKDAQIEGQPVTCSFLRLFDVELTGILAIGKARDGSSQIEPVVVYIPDDPVCPLKEYASTQAFTQALRERLLTKGYLEFFRRFVPARQQNALFQTLEDRLRPKVWVPEKGWYERQPDRQAVLHLREHAFTVAFLSAIIRQKAKVLQDDALFHAVPTAAEDQKTFEERLHYFEGTALQILNAAAFFVPVLGQVMLGVTAVQLGYEVFEGIESWTRGEREQAGSYLMDVVENLALAAALAAAGAGAGEIPANERIPVETPSFIEELTPVTLPDGKTRLWKPDLTPFAHDIVLPQGLEPDEFGLYHHQGKTWLALEDHLYSIKHGPGAADYRIEHPTKAVSYEPPLRHNGAGAWQHELDRPLEWEGRTLFRRLGHTGFSDTTAQHILRISDTCEAVLRRVLSENQRPPALLEDTIQRFRLDQDIQRSLPDASAEAKVEAFNTGYQSHSVSQMPGTALITRVYPQLPTVVAEELLRHASPAELEQLADGKVPSRLGEEIRVYQQQVRLARAYEGLYLEPVVNPDTDTLVLHSLEHLPGWSPEVRLEVRDGSVRGTLIDSVGPDSAPIRKCLSKVRHGYQTYDAEGHELHGRDDIYASILHALPDAQRAALGLPGTWDGLRLRRMLQRNPLLPRQTLRKVLRMPLARPGEKSPMRLADGRLGYPLSGKGAMSGYITRDTLLDMIRWIGLQNQTARSAEDVLAALEAVGLDRVQIHTRLIQLLGERQALESAMNDWIHASASIPASSSRTTSRSLIHDAIWQHWSETNLPEIGRSSTPLRLVRMDLMDFPDHLPDFVYRRAEQVQLVDIVLMESPPSLGLLQPEPVLTQFFRRFSHITSLEISRASGPSRSPTLSWGPAWLIASSLPALRELRMINLNIQLSSVNIDPLRALAQLERLDLSGNAIVPFIEPNLSGMRLRYLGLDRTGLDRWPAWLDRQALESLDEVSLCNNRIARLPDYLVDNDIGAGRHTRISLQGNVLLPATLLQLRLNEAGADRRFSFDLDVPSTLQTRLDEIRQEQATLQEANDNWTHASSSTAPPSDETVRARSRIGETILEFWRAYSEGQSFPPLRLEGIALEDFPRSLPTFFYTRVRQLHLTRVTAAPGYLNRFLGDFQHLTELAITGHSQPMTQLPPAMLALPMLERLELVDQGLVVDQQALVGFARLPRLELLNLTGNRIGAITDASGLAHLRWLYLTNTGLESWPEWVEPLLPLEILDLDDNRLTVLPEYILQNPRNDDAQTEISLLGNPLTHDTMYTAHVSEAYRRAYAFNMDLPEDIQAIEWRERHDSDSDSDFNDDLSSSGHGHSPGFFPAEEVPDVDDWLLGTTEENEVHRVLWNQLENQADGADLLRLVGRLTQTAPYRAVSMRSEFASRVWRVLEVAAHSTEDRLLFNGMAQEALIQPETGDQTCHDGAWLVFNQIEIRIYTEQSLKDVPALLRGQTLYRLTQRLYRLEELDNIAREQVGTRDEAEVRLAYRLRWARELDLPLPPSTMLYEAHANIRPGELDAALARVQQGENGEPFMRYAAQRDFWVDYLRETYAERFMAIEQAYQSRVLDVPDRFPGSAIEELEEEYAALQRQFKAEEESLIRELTILAGLDLG